MRYKIEYRHRPLEQAIHDLTCLAYIGVSDRKLIENLKKDCYKDLNEFKEVKKRYDRLCEFEKMLKKANTEVRQKLDRVTLIIDLSFDDYEVYQKQLRSI